MYYDGTVHVEPDDQCFECEYFLKGVTCPLLEALGVGVVSLETDITVQNCGFFKPFKRVLRLVEPDKNAPEASSPPSAVPPPEPPPTA